MFITQGKKIFYRYFAVKKAGNILTLCKQKNLTLAVAESCTGGLLGDIFTSIPGSSSCFIGGIIAYNNSVKENILKVDKRTLEKEGAVSEKTVIEMSEGLLSVLNTDITLAVSGIAGPGGGSKDKPVGTIWTNISLRSNRGEKNKEKIINYPHKIFYNSERNVNRIYSASQLLKHLEKLLQEY